MGFRSVQYRKQWFRALNSLRKVDLCTRYSNSKLILSFFDVICCFSGFKKNKTLSNKYTVHCQQNGEISVSDFFRVFESLSDMFCSLEVIVIYSSEKKKKCQNEFFTLFLRAWCDKPPDLICFPDRPSLERVPQPERTHLQHTLLWNLIWSDLTLIHTCSVP